MTPANDGGPDRAFTPVKSADRVLLVLDLLANRGPLRLSEVAEALALPKSSAYNLLHTMVARRYIELSGDGRTFRLGSRIWEISQLALGGKDLAQLARPLMERLVDWTEETVQLAQLDGVENVYLAIVESPHPMKLVSQVGTRLFAPPTGVGKVLMASLDEGEARRRLEGVQIPRFTVNTRVTVDEVMDDLRETARRGWGEDDEEYILGCRCVAMPVRGPSGDVVAAMSVSIPTPRYSDEVGEQARGGLAETVAELSRMLGYVEPAVPAAAS